MEISNILRIYIIFAFFDFYNHLYMNVIQRLLRKRVRSYGLMNHATLFIESKKGML